MIKFKNGNVTSTSLCPENTGEKRQGSKAKKVSIHLRSAGTRPDDREKSASLKAVSTEASYCGIAPFPNQSGISIRGRTKVSHLANKKIKSLLDMCAKSAILANTEMKLYYQKRIQQGKNKRSTINIIRNKLLSRIFAVVKRGTPYAEIKAYAA